MIKFLHTSDWQLGMTRHFFSEEAGHRFLQDRIDGVRRIGDLARQSGAAFVVVAGDAFESSFVRRQTVARAMEALATVPVPVYLLPGNHDAMGPGSLYGTREFVQGKPDHVHVLAESGVHPVGDDLEIVAAPWRSRRPDRDLVAESLDGLEPGPVRILLAHGALDTLVPGDGGAGAIRAQVLREALERGVVRYVALGDRHSATQAIPDSAAWYSGTHEPTAFVEETPGRVLAVSVDGDEVRVQPHHVAQWQFLEWRPPLWSDGDMDDLEARIHAVRGKERSVLRLVPEGRITLRQHVRLEQVLARAAETYGALAPASSNDALSVLPADGDFGDIGLSGFVEDAVTDLRARAEGGGEAAEEARGALELLVHLAGRAN